MTCLDCGAPTEPRKRRCEQHRIEHRRALQRDLYAAGARNGYKQNRSPTSLAKRNKKTADAFRERYRTDPAFREEHNRRTREDARAKRGCWGTCEICGAGPVMLHRDHNHSTGAQRGRLCPHCNWLLGHSKERKEVLLAAIAYLEKYG